MHVVVSASRDAAYRGVIDGEARESLIKSIFVIALRPTFLAWRRPESSGINHLDPGLAVTPEGGNPGRGDE